MKILITGASGFIGRNVKEYLQRNEIYNIYAPSSRELNCLDEECVTDYLKRYKFDCILHFAVYVPQTDDEKDRNHELDYNLRIFFNFAKNSSYYGKMFYAGSGAEYDKRYDIAKVAEQDIGKTIPTDPYGLMKYIIGQQIESSRNIYNIRLFGIFGKYENYSSKFISNVCCKAIKGIPLSMRQNVYFDYLWVEDFCRMVEIFLENEPHHHTYNIVSGTKISLAEICEIVRRVSGKQLPVFICKDGWGNEYTASNIRFLKEFSEFQYTDMEDAIKNLYEWYQNKGNINMYQLLYS